MNTQILESDTDTEDALFAVTQEIDTWRIGAGMSNVKLLKSYPALGSTKTFAKLLNRDSTSLVSDDWMPKYRSVLQLIQNAAEQQAEQEIFEDLGTSSELLKIGAKLFGHRGLNRVAFIEGDSGSGKTFALDALQRRHPGMTVRVEGSGAWKNTTAFLRDCLIAFGHTHENLPRVFDLLQHKLTDELRARRSMVLIDEAQHLTGEGLNEIKRFINKTPSCFIVAGQNTLWRRLQAASWQEAKQLRHNRCFAYLTFGAPSLIDCKLFVTRRAACEAFSAATWKALNESAAKHGSFAFLRDTVDEAKTQVPAGEAIDEATLLAAAHTITLRAGGK